jgi:hypothetical protein
MLGPADGSSGCLDHAIDADQVALKYAVAALARATAHYGIGEAYHRKGVADDSVRHFDLALHEVGYLRPQSRPERLLDIGRASVFFHRLPAGLPWPGGGPSRDRRIEIACATYVRLCQIMGTYNVLD